MKRVDGQATLRKGDRFRFTEDYYRNFKVPYREQFTAKYPSGTDRRLLAEAGVEGRVIWAGRSKDNPRLGTWRVGVLIPGYAKPVFINQRYMERIG